MSDNVEKHFEPDIYIYTYINKSEFQLIFQVISTKMVSSKKRT